MLLDSLLELVETLRDRVEKHGDELRKSEPLTRYALIDPMLQELGWNTDDPTQVVPEYRSKAGKADYALFGQGDQPTIIVEAKHLGASLPDAVSQVINYCMQDGFEYFAVTDGARWELYETHRRGNLTEKMVTSLDVRGVGTEVCLKALALWRPSVESGYVAAGSDPVAEKENVPANTNVMVTPQSSSAPDDREWLMLSELNPQSGSEHPVEVLFPDNSTASITAWTSLLVEMVNWLVNKNYIDKNVSPVQLPRSKQRYIVSNSPVHPSGKAFFNSAQVGDLYVEKNVGSMTAVKCTRYLVMMVGHNPAQFKVRFAPSK